MMLARDLAGRHGLRRLSRSYRGNCPVCGYAAGLSMREGAHGALARCFACGADESEILPAMGAPVPVAGPLRNPNEPARRRDLALRLWETSCPASGTPAETYLRGRLMGHVAACPDIRFRAACPHPESRDPLPAMIALIRDPSGRPIAVHRTYLRQDGAGKAAVTPAKATLGPYWGGAIRLTPAGRDLAVGEGIESAAATGLLAGGIPAWAAVAAGNMPRLRLPIEVLRVTIGVDHDRAGIEAGAKAEEAFVQQGRHARRLISRVEGEDPADLLRAVRG